MDFVHEWKYDPMIMFGFSLKVLNLPQSENRIQNLSSAVVKFHCTVVSCSCASDLSLSHV